MNVGRSSYASRGLILEAASDANVEKYHLLIALCTNTRLIDDLVFVVKAAI